MAEFTGERVIPGQVDQDLWNEHYARYMFASRYCTGKHVLDIACGTGYGAAVLGRSAASVVGLDRAPEAVKYARAHFATANVDFVQASCLATPFELASFDVIAAFEVIEHLEDWPKLLVEARRLLGPDGLFLVSTPNKWYYAESRGRSGPNPFHAHEFEFTEFLQALRDAFPAVTMFVQNHTMAIGFHPLEGETSGDVAVERFEGQPEESNFFLALCGFAPPAELRPFAYLPSAANLLREREQHIAALESELDTKNAWLEQALREHERLVAQFREQTKELEARNRWADRLNAELAAANGRIQKLQDELAAEQAATREMAAAYEAKIAALESENRAKTEWALETERRLSAELEAKCQELAECVQLLQTAESTVEERTLWAKGLDRQVQSLEAELSMIRASRWFRLGRRLGLGPASRKS